MQINQKLSHQKDSPQTYFFYTAKISLMKKTYLIKVLCLVCFLFNTANVFAQYGATMYDPIEVGTLYWGNTFNDTQDNSTFNGFGNDFGQYSDDIFYRFSVSNSSEVSISHCGSGFDTYMYILDANGNIIASNDDNGPLCSTLQSSITINLSAGDYYVVSEGYSSNSGYITTEIYLSGLPPSPPGANINNPIDLGSISGNFTYSDTKNNSTYNGYGNDIGQSSDDIYYKFQLTNAADIDISHCLSSFDTYLYLLDENGNVLYSRDDNGPLCATLQASLQVSLTAGIYFVVSEGFGSNSGDITTSISIAPEKTFEEEADYAFQHLDLSPVTSGILYDKAFPLADLEEYKGLTTDAKTSSDHLLQAYTEVYSASLSKAGLTTPEVLDEYLSTNYTSTSHSVGFLSYNYHYLDTNAISNNQLYISNGQLYDTPNRSLHPYIAATAIMASPLFPAIAEIEVGQHTFTYDPSIIFKNTTPYIANMTINFDDGAGDQVLFNGSGITRQANWQVARLYTVKILTTMSNGTVYESKSEVNVNSTSSEPVTACSGGTEISITGIPFDGSAYGKGVESGGGKATIYFSDANCGTNKITKPVIFLDGFDPTNKRDAGKIYKEFINKEVRLHNQDVSLADYLRTEGYDIVIFDFNDGGDLIEKNGLAVVELTKELHRIYGSNLQDDFIIIGPSMGALVGQYGLAYADANNIDTHTKLFISFDGPHQGANGAIGAQQMIDYFVQKGLISSIFFKKKRDKLHRVSSARQMLLHHSMANSEYPTPDNFRNIFLNNLAAVNKYPNPAKNPSKMRKVAIINGSSQLQSNQFVQPGGEMLYFQHKRKGLLGYVNGRAGDRVRIEINAAPSTGTQTTTDIWLNKPVINLLTWKAPRKRYYTSALSGNNSYDSAIGSLFEDPLSVGTEEQDLVDNLRILEGIFKNHGGQTLRHNIRPTSIPTTSAIDLQMPYPTLAYNFKNEDIGCTGKSPFDRVYAPLTNENHVQITDQTAIWFENEIKGTPQSFVPEYNISGAENICPSGNYFISDIPSGTTITWSTTGNISVPIGSTGSSVTVTASGSGIGTLTATIVSNCGTSVSAVKSINTVPIPIIPNLISNGYLNYIFEPENIYFDVCVDLYGSVHIDLPGAQNLQAYPISGGPNPQVSGTSVYWALPTTGYSYRNIMLEYDTNCGRVFQHVYFHNTCEDNNNNYRIYPNPANDVLTVSFESKEEASTSEKQDNLKDKKDYKVELLNNKGEKFLISNSNGNKSLILNTRSIPNGIYFLHITEGKNTIKKQIVIDHK